MKMKRQDRWIIIFVVTQGKKKECRWGSFNSFKIIFINNKNINKGDSNEIYNQGSWTLCIMSFRHEIIHV